MNEGREMKETKMYNRKNTKTNIFSIHLCILEVIQFYYITDTVVNTRNSHKTVPPFISWPKTQLSGEWVAASLI